MYLSTYIGPPKTNIVSLSRFISKITWDFDVFLDNPKVGISSVRGGCICLALKVKRRICLLDLFKLV